MYTIGLILVTPGLMFILAFIVAIPLTLIQYIDEWDERRKRRKALDKKIKFYKAVCANSDDEAYWLARIWNLQYERACLK